MRFLPMELFDGVRGASMFRSLEASYTSRVKSEYSAWNQPHYEGNAFKGNGNFEKWLNECIEKKGPYLPGVIFNM